MLHPILQEAQPLKLVSATEQKRRNILGTIATDVHVLNLPLAAYAYSAAMGCCGSVDKDTTERSGPKSGLDFQLTLLAKIGSNGRHFV